MSARGSRNSRGEAPTSNPSIRDRVPLAADERALDLAAQPPRVLDLGAAEDPPVARRRAPARSSRSRAGRRRRSRAGAEAASSGVKATWTRMAHRYANRDVATCYRHPDRETGLSCSECGRPICTDCVTFAPVGLRCPDHAAVDGSRRRSSSGRSAPSRRTSEPALERRDRHQDPGRDQRRRLPDHGRPGLADSTSPGGVALLQVGARSGPTAVSPRRLVAADHLRVPARQPDPHRLQHARPLVAGRARRAGARPRAATSASTSSPGSPERPARWSRTRTRSPSAPRARSSACSAPALILEWQATGSLAGNYLMLIVINLAISFAVPGISVGGHIGGLVGGIVARSRSRSSAAVAPLSAG